MILVVLVALPLAGGLLCWAAGRGGEAASRWIAAASMAADLILAIGLWVVNPGTNGAGGAWIASFAAPWIPEWGIEIHLAMDGLSLVMITLSALLGLVSVIVSWRGIGERVAFFHLNLCLAITGIVGVFLALDLFLFYLFWELMLIPMYFIIAVWGHEARRAAAIKFLIFTQAGGLLMLLSILALYFVHGTSSGTYTFDYFKLLGTSLAPAAQMAMMLGFFAAFAVKLPAFPLHTWLPDAHTQAPTAGSVILAGLLLKTGAYGLIRFVVPLFPQAALRFTPVAMALGVAGILYGALLAFAQDDFKRLVAYTSVSHLGFVLLGVFAWNTLALQGTVMQMVAHGLSTGALFVIAGSIQDRIHTRDMRTMGGFWHSAPRMGGMTLFFALASLGLPGLANFVAELLIFLGVYRVDPLFAIIAAVGLVFATLYSLWLVYRTFQGAHDPARAVKDFGGREMVVTGALAAALVWGGLFPRTIIDTAGPALRGLGVEQRTAIVPQGGVGQSAPAAPRLSVTAGLSGPTWSQKEETS